MTVKEIYQYIDEISPFALQSGWDNSGLCVGNMGRNVTKITVALDCTLDVAKEAVRNGSQLIVTHHPVIFRGIKKLDLDSVVGTLVAGDCSVISAHTNFDSAVMNDILCEKIGLDTLRPLAVEDGAPCGYVCECDEISAVELAKRIKSALGCKVIRFNNTGRKIRRVAVCSGSGGSFLGEVFANNCDAFVTGDVKHDVFIDSGNAGLAVFDAGHYYTENIFCEFMQKKLAEKFPQAEIIIAHSNKDILSYI